MADDLLVSLRDVGQTFAVGGVEALHGFSLDIIDGEFVTLLGPSGCGKSTVLRILAGLTQPSVGTVSGPAAPGLARREAGAIGFVFQDPALMPWASVTRNIQLPLRLSGLDTANSRNRVDRMLDLVGLTAFADALPHTLSGGMRMRVSIARALVTRPRLLLMDEPFAALDEISRARLNDDVLRLAQDVRCTVVFVTHSVYEAAYLSTRVAVMAPRPGRVLETVQSPLPAHRTQHLRQGELYIDLVGRLSEALARSLALAGQA